MSKKGRIQHLLRESLQAGSENIIEAVMSDESLEWNREWIVSHIRQATSRLLNKLTHGFSRVSDSASLIAVLASICPTVLNALEADIYHYKPKAGKLPQSVRSIVREEENNIRKRVLGALKINLQDKMTANLKKPQQRAEFQSQELKTVKDPFTAIKTFIRSGNFEEAGQLLTPWIRRMQSKLNLFQDDKVALSLYAEIIGRGRGDENLYRCVVQELQAKNLIDSKFFDSLLMEERKAFEQSKKNLEHVKNPMGYSKAAPLSDRAIPPSPVDSTAARVIFNIEVQPRYFDRSKKKKKH